MSQHCDSTENRGGGETSTAALHPNGLLDYYPFPNHPQSTAHVLGNSEGRALNRPATVKHLHSNVSNVHAGIFPSLHVPYEGGPGGAALRSRADPPVLLEDKRKPVLERVYPLGNRRFHLAERGRRKTAGTAAAAARALCGTVRQGRPSRKTKMLDGALGVEFSVPVMSCDNRKPGLVLLCMRQVHFDGIGVAADGI